MQLRLVLAELYTGDNYTFPIIKNIYRNGWSFLSRMLGVGGIKQSKMARQGSRLPDGENQ